MISARSPFDRRLLRHGRYATCTVGGEEGCFGRDDSYACLAVPGLPPDPIAAYQACFGTSRPTVAAKRVAMEEIVSGDYVLAATDETGSPHWARAVMNFHKSSARESSLLQIEHEHGSLTMTPGHILRVDGQWAAASTALPGSLLSDGRGAPLKVIRVVATTGRLIMPFTSTGRILAASASGGPALAATVNRPQVNRPT